MFKNIDNIQTCLKLQVIRFLVHWHMIQPAWRQGSSPHWSCTSGWVPWPSRRSVLLGERWASPASSSPSCTSPVGSLSRTVGILGNHIRCSESNESKMASLNLNFNENILEIFQATQRQQCPQKIDWNISSFCFQRALTHLNALKCSAL